MQTAASFSKVDVAGVQCGNCDYTLVDFDFDFDSDADFDVDILFDFGLDQVVGGIDMMQQACKLATRPHIVVSLGEPGMVGL